MPQDSVRGIVKAIRDNQFNPSVAYLQPRFQLRVTQSCGLSQFQLGELVAMHLILAGGQLMEERKQGV